MKNIFYCSNTQSDIFKHNTRSKFDSYIDISDLNYLPNQDLEAAIKSITFDNKRDDKRLKDQVLAIRSNICEYTVRNSDYDSIISLFNASKLVKDVMHIDFKNPTFFETRKELLSRAHFEIIDVNTDRAPDFASGSPTYIQIIIRKSALRMKKPFNIFLDSSCKKSKALYPKNNSMEFTIDLPERMNFRRNWHVSLKSLFLPNKLYNVHNCYFKFFYYNWKYFDEKKDSMFSIMPGHYSSLEDLIKTFNMAMLIWKIKLRCKIVDGKVVINYYDEWTEWLYSRKLYLSPNLAHILGFQKANMNKEDFVLDFNKISEHTAQDESDIFLLTPRNLIVCCDIVDDTIFGGEHVKLLRLVTNDMESTSDVRSYDFYQNEFVDLNVKEFKSIKIRIADATGKTVKCRSTFPTRLQLMFVNV